MSANLNDYPDWYVRPEPNNHYRIANELVAHGEILEERLALNYQTLERHSEPDSPALASRWVTVRALEAKISNTYQRAQIHATLATKMWV